MKGDTMNWTPDYNYNGNHTGWNDGNPYRVDDAAIAAPSVGGSLLRGFLKILLAVLVLAGLLAVYSAATHPLPVAAHHHAHRKDLRR